jgi:hypothetical protein
MNLIYLYFESFLMHLGTFQQLQEVHYKLNYENGIIGFVKPVVSKVIGGNTWFGSSNSKFQLDIKLSTEAPDL